MELTSLTLALVLGLGLLGADSVMRAGSVEVEVAIAPKVENISVDEHTLAWRFKDQLDEITSTASVVHPPEIRSRLDQGLGMALFEAVHAQNVAFALQRELGYNPDRIRFALFVENGAMRGLVSGNSHLVGNFSQVMNPNRGENLMDFVRRCALWGGSQLAPYSTALYLLQQHASDKDFTDLVTLVEHAKAVLPPTPTSFDRGLLDNVLGLVALFRNDPPAARKAFNDAMMADPTNPVPFLNAAFTDLEFNEYQKATDRMAELIRLAPPSNKVLLATAYMTWGAARMGGTTSKAPTACWNWPPGQIRTAPPRSGCGRKRSGSRATRRPPSASIAWRTKPRPRWRITARWPRSISIFPGATINR